MPQRLRMIDSVNYEQGIMNGAESNERHAIANDFAMGRLTGTI